MSNRMGQEGERSGANPRKTLPFVGPECDQCGCSGATKKEWVHEQEWEGTGFWDNYCYECHKKESGGEPDRFALFTGAGREDVREWHNMSCECRVWGKLDVSECDCKG
jgi:hypothetical protein